MKISEFQELIEKIYFERDQSRGSDATFRWFVEEVGELARALSGRGGNDPESAALNLREEFADVLAWLSTLSSIHGVDLEAAARAKYATGCPKCSTTPCSCRPA